jgi:hypothetical protein
MLHQYLELSESAHDLWVEGRLLEELGIPDDRRTRVEIIGGEIVVSPGPYVHHAFIVEGIHAAFVHRSLTASAVSWRAVQVVDFNLPRIGDGYIPDLIVLAVDEFEVAAKTNVRNLTVERIGMVVEVTSRSTAADDREPGPQRKRPTKWNGYAREGVEFYLLVDRAPDKCVATLFTEPDREQGVYVSNQPWKFGETIVLPEPFSVEIPTEGWLPWE